MDGLLGSRRAVKTIGNSGDGVIFGYRCCLSSNTMNTGCSTDFAAAAVCEATRRVQGELAVGFDGRMSAAAVAAAALAATAAGVEVGVVGVAENAGVGAGVGVAAAYKSAAGCAGLAC